MNRAGTSRDDHRVLTPCDHRRSRACPGIVGPGTLWVQVAALLPSRQLHHPLGCHRPRVPDRVVFYTLIQVLMSGCGYRQIADHSCSATTLRRRRDEGITLGLAEQLRLLVLGAHDQLFGLKMEQLAVDSCTTKAPCGARSLGPARSTTPSKS
jgi:transposase